VNEGHIFLGLAALVIGCVNLFFPQLVFFLQEGWKFQDAKPSELFILVSQIAGLVFIAIGILIFALSLLLQ
jgi:hypothetical protein